MAKQRDRGSDIRALEREIDRLVYELYGLTRDKIALIEDRPMSPRDIILIPATKKT